MNRSSITSEITRLGKQSLNSKAMSVKRPLKLLLVMGIFLFFGVYRLRWVLAVTFDWSGLYLSYLSAYIGNLVLSMMIGFTDLNYVTRQSWLGQLQGTPIAGTITFEGFMNVWVVVVSLEIVIGIVGVLAVYSTLALRRSYLTKIACVAIILAGLFDPVSSFPIIESIAGVVCLLLLLRPDVKDAYAQKEGRPTRKMIGEGEEVTFRANMPSPREKQRAGKKCPNCGLLLPPSAKYCRRCKTKLVD